VTVYLIMNSQLGRTAYRSTTLPHYLSDLDAACLMDEQHLTDPSDTSQASHMGEATCDIEKLPLECRISLSKTKRDQIKCQD